MKKIVHIIDIQYLEDYSNNSKNTAMHDLRAIYNKVYNTLKSVAKECFVHGQNHRFYPNPPKMSDLQIVSLAIAAECTEITSENLLWSKIKKDYPDMFPCLVHRATFNRRRKMLRDITLQCAELLGSVLTKPDESFVIDSMPVPTCKIVRERKSKACRREEYDEVMAKKGYSSILGGFFIGYKIHIITTESGVYRDLLVTSGNEHDTVFLKHLGQADDHLRGRELIGDRGYIGAATQLQLFDEIHLTLKVPYRRNQKDFKRYSKIRKLKRKTIEVVFSQYCDEYSIRKNYAKRFSGFDIRIITKITAKTFKQYWNYLHGRPINQTKHSLAA
jgi:hypothetical protein